MKKIFFTIILVLISLSNLKAITYNSDPKIFVQELVQDALNILSDKSLSKEDKSLSIEKIALENVDIRAIGLYTLGETRKKVDKNTLEKYQGLFEKYFLKSLISRLSDYSSQKFEVIDSTLKSSNYTMVKSKILSGGKTPDIQIDWRIYTKDPNKPLIRDLIVEGLSLAKTQKEEFQSILISNDNNINALFIKLEEFVSN